LALYSCHTACIRKTIKLNYESPSSISYFIIVGFERIMEKLAVLGFDENLRLGRFSWLSIG